MIRGPGNAGGIITFLRSDRRSLVILNGHSCLMLILLPLVILIFMLLHLLTLVLPLLFYHKMSMIDASVRLLSEQSFNDSCILFRYDVYIALLKNLEF